MVFCLWNKKGLSEKHLSKNIKMTIIACFHELLLPYRGGNVCAPP